MTRNRLSQKLPRFPASNACQLSLLTIGVLLTACDPKPPSAPPPTSPPATGEKAAAHAAHGAHHPSSGATGKTKREVIRTGVESLDVSQSGTLLHLLVGRYDSATQPPVLEYLRSSDEGMTWSAPVRVDLGATAPHQPHRGQDAQIAASGDRLVTVWTSPGTGFNGRGPMATAISDNGGKTWRPGPNPADDGGQGDHSFVDIAADATGTFHLVWLDARGTNKAKGLRYASSRDGGQTWSRNLTLEAETCECCWNSLAIGSGGSLHVLFRDKNPRDMALVSSLDGGANWTAPVPVGRFNWDFQGCPHVGGGLLGTDGQVHALVWTGAAGQSGAYHVHSSDRGRTWSAPQRLGDTDARRGDLASASTGSLAAVWDRVADGESRIYAATSSDGGRTWSAPTALSNPGVNAAYPRVVAVSGSYRVFWTESVPGQPSAWRTAKLN